MQGDDFLDVINGKSIYKHDIDWSDELDSRHMCYVDKNSKVIYPLYLEDGVIRFVRYKGKLPKIPLMNEFVFTFNICTNILFIDTNTRLGFGMSNALNNSYQVDLTTVKTIYQKNAKISDAQR